MTCWMNQMANFRDSFDLSVCNDAFKDSVAHSFFIAAILCCNKISQPHMIPLQTPTSAVCVVDLYNIINRQFLPRRLQGMVYVP